MCTKLYNIRLHYIILDILFHPHNSKSSNPFYISEIQGSERFVTCPSYKVHVGYATKFCLPRPSTREQRNGKEFTDIILEEQTEKAACMASFFSS